MKVKIEEKTYHVGWKYENPVLQTLFEEHNITQEDVKNLTHKELVTLLGVKELPPPDITKCFIKDDDHDILMVEGIIKRHVNDLHVKAKARSYSLHKALTTKWPGVHNYAIRRKFWETYLTRPRNHGNKKKIVEMVEDNKTV